MQDQTVGELLDRAEAEGVLEELLQLVLQEMVEGSTRISTLSAWAPELAAQWHPTKNGDLCPDQIRPDLRQRVWWQCVQVPEHEWQASPLARTKSRAGCPFCTGRRFTRLASLAVKFPDLAAQWHPTKNGDLRPDQIRPGFNQGAWWQCPKDPEHEWRAYVSVRSKGGSRCPFCAGKRSTYNSSLASLFPELAAEWHSTRNGKRLPETASPRGSQSTWWQCSNDPDHVWSASIVDRVSKQTGCPYCTGERRPRSKPLSVAYPELAAEWHPTKNGKLGPDTILSRSPRKVWWRCSKEPAEHDWQAVIYSRTQKGAGCPYCAGRRVAKSNSLAVHFPFLAAEWHPTKNGRRRPGETSPLSHLSVWWLCSRDPSHEWRAVIKRRTHSGKGCPSCKKLRDVASATLARQSPAVAVEWHPTLNEELHPGDVLASSDQVVWWRCSKNEDHEWTMGVAERIKDPGCPFCQGLQYSPLDNLEAVYPDIARHWDPDHNGDLVPCNVPALTQDEHWWRCPRGHVTHASVRSRTLDGVGCHVCAGGKKW